MQEAEKRGSFVLSHPIGLQISLPEEAQFPAQERWLDQIKNETISLLPN
jgi:hypothetical protein